MREQIMSDLYDLLYFLCSPKGHRRKFSLLSNITTISEKTLRRRYSKSEDTFDTQFWREHGYLSNKDWSDLQDIKTYTKHFKGAGKIIQYLHTWHETLPIPEDVRKIHPVYLKFILPIVGFQLSCVQNKYTHHFFNDAANFVISTVANISEILFALIDNDSSKYDIKIDQLQRRLPILFPKELIWQNFFSQEKNDLALRGFFEELLLLGILCFDMAFMKWCLYYDKGESPLIGALKKLSENKDEYFRIINFNSIKNEVAINYNKKETQKQKQVDLSKPIRNRKFYEILATDSNGEINEDKISQIRKRCEQIYMVEKHKYITPETLDDFLNDFFPWIGVECANYERVRDHYRNAFAHDLIVREVLRNYVSDKTSCGDLVAKLIQRREWLCKKVFTSPSQLQQTEEGSSAATS